MTYDPFDCKVCYIPWCNARTGQYCQKRDGRVMVHKEHVLRWLLRSWRLSKLKHAWDRR